MAAKEQSVRKPNETQKSFILQVKQNAVNLNLTEIVHYPSRPIVSSSRRPVVEDWYKKPVVLCAPHLQFQEINISCDEAGCSGHFKSDGWGDNDRYLHGLHGGCYLVQARYHCSNGSKCPRKKL